MACKSDLFHGLKFVILAGAPDIEDLHFPASKKSGIMVSSAKPHAKLTMRSLHFAGAIDAVVFPEQSLILASRFQSPQYVEHPQGHCIPTKPHYISIISTFLESQLNSTKKPDIKITGISVKGASDQRPFEGDDRL